MRIIGGEWRGRRLAPLRGKAVRPTADRVRESWMSAMGGRFDGWRVVDLFAGSGALGLECLSRGAEHVTFVERAPGSLAVLRRNVAMLGAQDRCAIVRADVFDWLDRAGASGDGLPDVALADPPYGEGIAGRLVERFLRDPFAKALWVEHPSAEDIVSAPGSRQRRYGDTTLSFLPSEA